MKEGYLVTTYTATEQEANEIINTAVQRKLPGGHVQKARSRYNWNHNAHIQHEYRVDVACTEDQLDEAVDIIRICSRYRYPSITATKTLITEETFDWMCRDVQADNIFTSEDNSESSVGFFVPHGTAAYLDSIQQ